MISVIIPTYNDEGIIGSTIANLKANAYKRLLKEVIVVDCGSSDNTIAEARKEGAIIIRSLRKSRAAQLNLGAQSATGDVLYFVRPGFFVPENFTNEIVRTVQHKVFMGSFKTRIAIQSWFSNVVSFFINAKVNLSRLDYHSVFVVKELFDKAGGLREDLAIHEDREFIDRLSRYSAFTVIKQTVLCLPHVSRSVPAEIAHFVTSVMYLLGYSQEKLMKVYKLLARTESGEKEVQVFTPSHA